MRGASVHTEDEEKVVVTRKRDRHWHESSSLVRVMGNSSAYFLASRITSPILLETFPFTHAAANDHCVYVEMEISRGVKLNEKKFSSGQKAKEFVLRLLRELTKLNVEHGFRHINLHANNIMVDDDGDYIKLLDYDALRFGPEYYLVFKKDLEFLYPRASTAANAWWNLQDAPEEFSRWMCEKAEKARWYNTLEEVLRVYETDEGLNLF